jgi:hypothetical protein
VGPVTGTCHGLCSGNRVSANSDLFDVCMGGGQYLVLTKGKSILAFAVNSILYVLRGFKRSSSYSVPQSKPRHSSPVAPDGPGRAESNVISKWGRD